MLKLIPKHGPAIAFLCAQHLLIVSNTQALGNDRFTLAAGSSITKFNSQIIINGDVQDNNTKVDLEDDLGQKENVDFLALKAYWRFADRHRISLEFNPFSRDNHNTLDKNFDFEDNSIQAGASISTESNFAIYDINYIYSFYQTPDMEIGVSGGIYWMDLEFEISASGFIEDENGVVTFDDSFKDNVSADVPLPLVGFYFDYQLAEHWELHSAARYFQANIDNYEGSITSLLVAIDYNIWKALSIGLSVARFELDVETDESNFRGEFNWEYSGAQFYLKAAF